jgi:hypothetical protein
VKSLIFKKYFILDNARKIANQLMQHLNIHWYELYNVLKFIRNTKDMSSLKLGQSNIINIIGDIYTNDYKKK